jgi:hypothetical protein
MKFDLKQAMADAVARHHAEFPEDATGPTAPKSEAGTQRTRLNAYKHGLTGQIHLLTAAEQTAFDAHCKSICEALAPVGALEIDLAQAIAEGRWRLKRARAIETSIFAVGQLGLLDFPVAAATTEDAAQLFIEDTLLQARTWLSKNDNFLLLALYEQRINRTIERNMAELRTLRAERKAAREQALEEAVLLAQLAESKGEKYDAAADFPPELLGTDSVFSPAAITRLIARNQRLNEARDHAKTRVNSKSGHQMPAAA